MQGNINYGLSGKCIPSTVRQWKSQFFLSNQHNSCSCQCSRWRSKTLLKGFAINHPSSRMGCTCGGFIFPKCNCRLIGTRIKWYWFSRDPGHSGQIRCRFVGIVGFCIPSAFVKVWKPDLRSLKLTLRGGGHSYGQHPKVFHPRSTYDPWKLIFRCENPLQADLLATWWLDYFWCFFLEGWNVHPKNASVYSSNSFEFHFVSLNIMVSQRTPAKHQIKYCKFILMTRPNQKKTNMYWFIHSQKKQGQKLQKKTPWNPETQRIENRSHLDTRVQESYLADANISKPVKYRARHWSCLRHAGMDIGEFDLLEILYWTLHGTKRSHLEKITVLPMLRTHQHLKRLCDSKPVTLLVLL